MPNETSNPTPWKPMNKWVSDDANSPTKWLHSSDDERVAALFWEPWPDTDGGTFEFAIWSIYHTDDGTYEFDDAGAVSHPAPQKRWQDAEPEINGFVRWDGCTNISFDPCGVMLHACSAEELQAIFDLVMECRKEATRMGQEA